MSERKKIYFIGIGGIGVSALARYYRSRGYSIFWSDKNDSELIHSLQNEGMNIIIWSDNTRITEEFVKVVYSEAIPKSQEEFVKALELWIDVKKYSDALWEIANSYKLIAVAGTHGKSTTTSMISQIFKNSNEDFVSVVWTLLKDFDGKNFFSQWKNENYFILEACEYKEHFLAYKPTLVVITNIEYDHADYFKTPKSYISAYEKLIKNIVPGGFCILNGEEKNSKGLIWKRKDIHYIVINQDSYATILPGENISSNTEFFPEIVISLPWEHIHFDAKLAYLVSHLAWIDELIALESLENYSGVWRRMEKIWNTRHNNLLMSDYGHHPTEISTTLAALKSWYSDKKLYVVFQPHQYSRTLELLEEFITCFSDADTLIIPNIYESRDSDKDKQKINSKILTEKIHHHNVIDGNWLENTLKLIEQYDRENPNSSIILLLGAWDIDNLRYKIKTS